MASSSVAASTPPLTYDEVQSKLQAHANSKPDARIPAEANGLGGDAVASHGDAVAAHGDAVVGDALAANGDALAVNSNAVAANGDVLASAPNGDGASNGNEA